MKRLLLPGLCAPLLLQACHSSSSTPASANEQLKQVQWEHAKENAARDDAAMQQQIDKLRTYQQQKQAKQSSGGAGPNTNKH